MKHLAFLLILLAFPLLFVACAGDESSAPTALEGPALIMFYTDN